MESPTPVRPHPVLGLPELRATLFDAMPPAALLVAARVSYAWEIDALSPSRWALLNPDPRLSPSAPSAPRALDVYNARRTRRALDHIRSTYLEYPAYVLALAAGAGAFTTARHALAATCMATPCNNDNPVCQDSDRAAYCHKNYGATRSAGAFCCAVLLTYAIYRAAWYVAQAQALAARRRREQPTDPASVFVPRWAQTRLAQHLQAAVLANSPTDVADLVQLGASETFLDDHAQTRLHTMYPACKPPQKLKHSDAA